MTNARSLTATVWYLLTQHLGLRGRQEHHEMYVEDFTIKCDDSGRRFLTFTEGCTKTRPGGLRKKQRIVIPKMFETKDVNRCPLIIFEYFLSKRPVTLRSSGPIYLAIINNPKTEVWFKVSRLGVNSIDNLMKSLIKSADIKTDKHLTNHSARRTVVKKLKKSGHSKDEIIEITGHANTKGLDPYDSGDEEHQRKMSHAIDQHTDQAPGPSHSGFSVKTYTQDTLPKKSYQFFSEENYRSTPSVPSVNYNFYNCKVSLGTGPENEQSTKIQKRRRVICSSDSSQE